MIYAAEPRLVGRGSVGMQSSLYYRTQARRSRRLAQQVTQGDDRALLERIALDLDDLALDLERNAIKIIDACALPQLYHPPGAT